MSETICLIDSDAKALKRNREILEMFGYRVIAADRADIAFSHIMSEAISLVISDVYLPEVSGIDLLEKMRRNRVKVPVLLLGKSLTGDTIERAADTGAIGFFEKPVSTVKMVAFIQQLFGNSNGNGNGKVGGNGKPRELSGIKILNVENTKGTHGTNENQREDNGPNGNSEQKTKKKKRFFGLF